ncbi:cytochrome b-c1 complex subunit 7 [Zopfochytrium polystomum]|nr:cytochrome b-c1 complex subunit 7 [Zopfochytrium polystomum]
MSVSLLQSLRSLRASQTFSAIGEVHANLMGYRKMGLKYDDLIPDESPIIQEALHRLSPRDTQERIFRFRRAFFLSNTQSILDPPEWTKPEEDVPYLRPLIDLVESEIASKEAFDNLTSIPEALKKRNKSS